jgi:DNA-binding HxlR family transcriptional regulator
MQWAKEKAVQKNVYRMKKCTNAGMSTKPDSGALPVHIYIKVIGGKWKPEILWYLRKGPVRFGDLQRKVTGITQVTLTKNLRELEADGIVTRTMYPEIPPRVDYRLTEFGESVFPVLDVISKWGRKFIRERETRQEIRS